MISDVIIQGLAAVGFVLLGSLFVAWLIGRGSQHPPQSKAREGSPDDPRVIVAHGGPLDGYYIELKYLSGPDGERQLQERGAQMHISEWNPYLRIKNRNPELYIEEMRRSEAESRGYRTSF
jgi:hypothetical protein